MLICTVLPVFIFPQSPFISQNLECARLWGQALRSFLSLLKPLSPAWPLIFYQSPSVALSRPVLDTVTPTDSSIGSILAHGYLRCHIVISGTVMLLLVSSCSWLLDVKLWKAYLRQGSKILTTSRAFISGIRAHIGTTIMQFDCFIRDYETMNVMGLQKKVIPSLLYVSVCTGIRFK